MNKDTILNKDAILKDLNIQWTDHHHMRDQTWKTLTNSLLLFLGVVGLELKGVADTVMVPAYILLTVASLSGLAVSCHHRLRQKEKFKYIRKYQDILELTPIKNPIKEEFDNLKGCKRLANKANTVLFISIMHGIVAIIAIILLLRRLPVA
jgi:hypothetical protein